jgi:glycosyltransferase involved in cell wall biosynthesis
MKSSKPRKTPLAGPPARENERALNLLWVIDIDYSTRRHHGAMLRYLNYARQLMAAGHRVYFVVQAEPGEFHREREFFDQLRRDGAFADFFECSYSYPRWKTRLATMSILPSLGNQWLAADQAPVANYCRELAQKLAIDLIILSNRQLFFLAPNLVTSLPTIIDFGDCFTLYRMREIKLLWRNRAFGGLLASLRELAESYLKERYYSRSSDANIAVSPIDKRTFDKVNGRPEKNRVLLNGVSPAASVSKIEKVAARLIFSGNMNFPPNYESAIWFIDHVLPSVLRAHPETEFVVAGANPVPQLLSRANNHIRITGFVEDMASEIAASALYVAPMIMGGGFKNKVVEALISGTYVAATPMAVEFLGPEAVGQMLVGDSAESLAARIAQFLSHPEQFDARLSALHAMVAREFSWEHRTAELLEIIQEVLRARSVDRQLEPAAMLPS